MTNNYDLFLEAFCKIEKVIKANNAESFTAALKKQRECNQVIRTNYQKLLEFKEFRNLCSHNKQYLPCFAIPSDSVVLEIQKIADELLSPEKAYKYAVKRSEIFTTKLTNLAKPIIQEMVRKTYTHVPVIDNEGKLIGIFSESSIAHYFGHRDEIILDSSATIQDFSDYIDFEARENERFDFISREALLLDVTTKFKVSESSKRLGAVFITQNGSITEQILGMLTAWDVLGH
jgi:CBS domain-containing protein